jgi:prepilin-type N-terminal cleavage/methylation domain-containing protein
MIRANTKPRRGFTLVELLVVLAIIAILIGIIVPAVQRVRAVGTKTTAVAEINQLALGAADFKREFGFFPPDSGKIPTTATTADAQEQQTLATLRRMFPRWNPSGALGLPNAGSTLNGNQCLVFFLGGPGGVGWDGANPANATPGPNKKGPYYDFPTNRLIGAPASHVDPWRTPYAYFRSVDGNYPSGAVNYGTPAGSIQPFTSGGRFVNQTGVQVISAGPDLRFGPGGTWTPGTGSYTQAAIGGDDLGNFNEGLVLGATN